MLQTKQTIEKYVPHSNEMLLIDRVLDFGPEHIVTETDVGPHLPCFSKGAIPAYLGLEIMAQSIAVWSGMDRDTPGPDQPIGFLLGTRKYECSVREFANGVTLQIQARQIIQSEGLASFKCKLSQVDSDRDQNELATANVNVYSAAE